MDQLSNQVIFNAIIVAALQWLKNSKWFPWLSKETGNINRIIAVILSGAAAIGVHTNFDHATGVLTITGLTFATISTGLYEWLRSFVIQQLVFKATVQQPASYTIGISGQPYKAASAVAGTEVIQPITEK